ncbi:MAG TPA: hypothetical protein VK458_12095 [Myxococcaceae bacterium]|nr:hypothetical protein [Myxococcaceae bacterium]
MTVEYPDDCLQSLAEPWWEKTEKADLRRGRLLWSFIPHADQIPWALIPVGRSEPTDHHRGDYRIEQLRAKQTPTAPRLPVAALPQYPGEAYIAQRAKKRPALVLYERGGDIPPALRGGSSAKWMTNPTLLVAPYYGTEPNQKRGGWNPKLVERIRHCEFPQYLWDKLPIGGAEFSILRFDHLQPIGHHHDTYEATSYCLSKGALELVDEWLQWLMTGRMSQEGILLGVREGLMRL